MDGVDIWTALRRDCLRIGDGAPARARWAAVDCARALSVFTTVAQPAFCEGVIIEADRDRDLKLMSDAKSPIGAPQSVVSESKLEPATASEVRTKLDLARMFLDMGDPESARHMLDEVLNEGDSVQKQEAQRLIDLMP
jgi:FimV-like protein